MKSSWFKIALFFLVITAFLGTVLRYMQLFPVPELEFRYFLHSHSHTAFMGWVYNALFLFMVYLFLPGKISSGKVYKWLFWLLQTCVLGMTITFAMQGYKAFSITFSTLHTLLFYVFAGVFLHHLKKHANPLHKFSRLFARAALFFMVLSSFGPWALAVFSAKGLAGTSIYNMAIYFYLHFQYNGFFLFSIFAIMFHYFESVNIRPEGKLQQAAFWIFFLVQFPNYLLSLFWLGLPFPLQILASISAILQLLAAGFLIRFVAVNKDWFLKHMPRWGKVFFIIAGWALTVKLLLQVLSIFPAVQPLTYAYKEAVIGYLHLSLLAFTSLALLAIASRLKWISLGTDTTIPVFIFLSGILFNLTAMMVQGLAHYLGLPGIPYYQPVLLITSLMMLAGIAFIFTAQLSFDSSRFFFTKGVSRPIRNR